MKHFQQIILSLAIALALVVPASGAVLLDDDWDDGDRTDTNLPDESAWYANVASGIPTLSASVGSLTGLIRVFETNTSSRLWITHFTPPGSPAELGVGDTLNATLIFVPTNVASSTTSRGLRIGIFNFSEPGAARVSADGFSTGSGTGAPGMNVTGYMLNMNFAQTLISSPLEIMRRTDLATNNLMGASAVFTRLSTGGGSAGSPGFSNDMTYTLEFTLKRTPGSLEITTTFSDTNGWKISHTAIDTSSPVTHFDGFAIRPATVADVADSLTFTQFKVEHVPFAPRITSIQLSAFDATITWETIPNRSYDLEAREVLNQGSWMVIHSVTASGVSESFTDLDATSRLQRFYRVVQLPQ